MSAVITALDAEIAAVEADLRDNPDPRQKRLAQLHAVRRMYLVGDPGQPPPESPQTTEQALAAFEESRQRVLEFQKQFAPIDAAVSHLVNHISGGVPRTTGRKPSPERQRALAAAKAFLAEFEQPVKTAAIFAHLVAHGVQISGTIPVNNLSAMLHHSPDFRSHGREGWTLKAKEAA